MWSAIVDFGIWVLGLFGFGKPKSDVQAMQATGVQEGQDRVVASESATAARTEADIAQSVNSAPDDKAAVLDALKSGSV